MRLVLFDIDGTLIDINRAGRHVLGEALLDVVGTVGSLESYHFAGMTDRRIILDVLASSGLSQATIEAKLPLIYNRMAHIGRKHFSTNGLKAKPGVVKLLNRLDQHHDVVIGLQTGNIEATAKMKLEAAGISTVYFRVGAYGSDAVDRNDLPLVAWNRTKEKLGFDIEPHDTVIVGDTPFDILSATKNGALTIAVAGGSYPIESLAKYMPNYLLEDFKDTGLVLKSIIGERSSIDHS